MSNTNDKLQKHLKNIAHFVNENQEDIVGCLERCNEQEIAAQLADMLLEWRVLLRMVLKEEWESKRKA